MKTTGAETKIQKPKTKKGKRALQAREPKLVSVSQYLPAICIHVINTRQVSASSLLFQLSSTSFVRCQVEDSKRALILFGGKTSQITKDVLSDLHKLKSSVTTYQHSIFPALFYLSSWPVASMRLPAVSLNFTSQA